MTPEQVTDQQVQDLRDFIDEQDDVAPYTTAALKAKIAAANGNVGAVAYYIWVSKAAALSTLVDITEGGSSRRNSQAYTAAKDMVARFMPYVPTDPVNIGGRTSRTRAIVRP
jgi:hypothetical protein